MTGIQCRQRLGMARIATPVIASPSASQRSPSTLPWGPCGMTVDSTENRAPAKNIDAPMRADR
jgi:hypothetical protein